MVDIIQTFANALVFVVFPCFVFGYILYRVTDKTSREAQFSASNEVINIVNSHSQTDYTITQLKAVSVGDAVVGSELDSILEYVRIDATNALAVVEYVHEPDLKVVVKICHDVNGLSEKSWKRAVRFTVKDNKRIGYITMNNKQYILRTAGSK